MIAMRNTLLALSALSMLTGCQQGMQNRYNYTEVGKSQLVEFGTIVAAREVDVQAANTGAGALAGGTAGGVAGYNVGNGYGQTTGLIAGAVIGAAIGAAAEQAVANYKGIEYVVTRESGKTITIVQPKVENERIFHTGERVMVQLSGSYQRVLPAENLPTEIKRPKGIKVVD